MKDIIKVIAFVLAMIILLGLGIYGYSLKAQDFNNGICKECGGKYKLIAVDRRMKYYVCEDCGHEYNY